MTFETVVMPTDFSECAAVAMQHAIDLAQRDNAELIILHVVEPQHQYGIYGMEGVAVPRDMDEQVRAAAEKHLLEIQKQIPDGVSSRILNRCGSPATEIAAVAADSKRPIIVVSTHGYKGWRKFLLGSTTERIVRLVQCPVLTIPAGADLEES